LLGLNCNEQNFITKSGVQRLASKYGFIVANPDTTPRDCEIECAGYYIDATDNYQMFSYINDEFYELIIENFNVDINRIGIFG
jgi:S-formylglutathione hydrolase